MISLMPGFARKFSVLTVRCSFSAVLIFSLSLFSLANAEGEDASTSAPTAPSEETAAPTNPDAANSSKDSVSPLVELPHVAPYMNYAQKGSYENETWFSEVPQWHYYDMFGNKITDGFYLYGLSSSRDNLGALGAGASNLALHPFMRFWFNGLMQVADLHEDGGIMALIGDRVKSKFTPWTFNQTLFDGARFDAFYKMVSLTFLTNRISNTGTAGIVLDASTATTSGDWLTGLHPRIKLGENAEIGGTYVNIHHEESKNYSNPLSGTDSDTLHTKTYTGLSLKGLDFNLKNNKYLANGEFVHSQEFLDGNFLPQAGIVATVNGFYDIFDKWRCGGELYSVGSRYQTNFSCPAHPLGDGEHIGAGYPDNIRVGKYQYSLIEDNDDKDEFPENGRSRYLYFTQQTLQGDPDGVIAASWDKDKNGIWDYKEDFLDYDADPPESKILFDRNNNGTPDEIEDDAYPDYPYVPSYYLPGERYYRLDDFDNKWETKWADSATHKGLAGYHLYSRFEIIPNLELTLGGIFDRSQDKTFQTTYANGKAIGEVFDAENASDIYFLAHYKKGLSNDKAIILDNYFRKVQDNIPNHTLGFTIDPGTETVSYYTIVDKLNARDMFSDAVRVEFDLFNNRGFNYAGIGKFEFQKHTPHLEFNYNDISISSLCLINKCHYVLPLPFAKDLFLVPKYKNLLELGSYSPRADSLPDTSLEASFHRSVMTNEAAVVCEWKMTEKTSITAGLQLKKFDDLLDSKENYWEPCGRIQLMIKDRYSGLNLILTTGISRWAYIYNDNTLSHNPLNNPRGAVKNVDAHDIFIKVHAGF